MTHEQNLVLPYVKKVDLYAVWQELVSAKLAIDNIGLVSDMICCPGLDYCSLATARSIPISQSLSERFADIERQKDIGELKIKISGCINACGHHHAGHIGILGLEKKGVEYYQITLGGSGDENASVGEIIGPGFSYETVVDAVEKIIEKYKDLRNDGETFLQAYRRVGAQPFKEAVMPLIKDNEFADDLWQYLDDQDALPDTGFFVVSLARLKSDQACRNKHIKLGVKIDSDAEAEELQPYLGNLSLIVLEFPKFTDGRAYSQARVIREHLGYEGELRASGDIYPDQAVLMLRCGFDTFDVPENVTLDTWKKCVEILNTNYQRSYAIEGDEVRID